MVLSPTDVCAVLSALSLFLVIRIVIRRKRLPYPPGPPPSFLGNLMDVPTSREAEKYADMSKRYGPLLHLRVLDRHLVVINTLKVAEDLLERRGAIYSDRPQFTMLGELMGWGWAPTFQPYGQRWRAHRRVFQNNMSTLSSHHLAIQQYANCRMLAGLLNSPKDFLTHTHLAAASGILMMSYGIDIDQDSKYLELCEAGVESIVEAGVPGTYAVDWISSLKHLPSWVPGANFKKKARAWKTLSTRVFEEPFAHARSAVARGVDTKSWVCQQLNRSESRQIPEEILKACTATTFSAGVDTIKSCVNAAILALVLHPDIQDRVYREIVTVVGQEKLPDPKDRHRLPFTEAFLREVYRFYPPVPLGIPHKLMEDDVYNGYFVPRGTTVLANIWAMCRDPKLFHNPNRFDPSRFLSVNGEISTAVPDPRAAVFGFGRRVCPGRLYGDSAVWTAIATIVACFTLMPSPEGRPSGEMRSGLGSGPVPFKCVITARSNSTATLIAEAAAATAELKPLII